MTVIIPKPNVPPLLGRPELFDPVWYEKFKNAFTGSSLALASQSDATTGTNNVKYASPLRVADAIKGYAFPVRTGGVSRTIVDRSRDWLVVNDFSDGTGSGSNNIAALNAATTALIADPSKAILITRPFGIPSTWSIGPTSSIYAEGIKVSGQGDNARIYPTSSMTNVISITGYPFTIENLNFNAMGGLATNAINIDKGNNTYIGLVRKNVFSGFSGRCINTAYLNDGIQVIENHAASCGIFWTLQGGNYECLGAHNILNFAAIGVQILHTGALQVEGLKYHHNTHLASTVSVYMGGSYFCLFDHNVFGSHRNSGSGIWLDSTTYPNTANQFRGNFIGGEGFGNFGIVVSGTGANCNDNMFDANELSDWPQAGISIAGSGSDTYLGQTVINNIVRYSFTPAQAAIVMSGTPGALVKNNHLYTPAGTGLSLGGTSTGSLYGNCIFRGGGLSVGGSGWTLEGANR